MISGGVSVNTFFQTSFSLFLSFLARDHDLNPIPPTLKELRGRGCGYGYECSFDRHPHIILFSLSSAPNDRRYFAILHIEWSTFPFFFFPLLPYSSLPHLKHTSAIDIDEIILFTLWQGFSRNLQFASSCKNAP